MSDLDIYTSIAANLEESGWSSVLSQLDTETFAKLTNALDGVKDVAEAKDEDVPADPAEAVQYLSGRFDKVVKGIKAHRKRLEAIDMRLAALEAGGGGGGGSAGGRATTSATTARRGGGRKKGGSKRKARKLKNQADLDGVDEKEPATRVDDSRKHFYRFGSRNVQVVKPLEGYPTGDRKGGVSGDLTLDFVHGYNGQSDDARQNICLSPDGQLVIYHIAAVCIVCDPVTREQRFFTKHNDDVTTICLDPREGSTLVASGQKDPKDTPGQGKDLPKVWIWDYTTMKPVKLLNDICWGKVARCQWSHTGFLYVIGGDDDQTLKIFNSEDFRTRGPCPVLYKGPTTREQIFGFVINPNPSEDPSVVDEFVIYGLRKASYALVKRGDNGFTFKTAAVTVGSINSDGETAFFCAQFLPNGNYALGGKSGTIYVCKGKTALAAVSAHGKGVGDMCVDRNGLLVSGGFDQQLKKWSIFDGPLQAPASGRGKKRGGPRPPAALVEEWSSGVIQIPGSDFKATVRCMTYDENKDEVYVGSKTNQIMVYNFGGDDEKNGDASIFVDGHDGSIWGLCTSPIDPALFLTGGYDNAVKLWDANEKRCIDTLEFEKEHPGEKSDPGNQISCAAWSADGQFIAVGSEQSNLFLLQISPLRVVATVNIPPKRPNGAIEKVAYLRFSPDSSLLGVAHMDSRVYIFKVNGDGLTPWGVRGEGPRPPKGTKRGPIEYGAAPSNLQWSEIDGNAFWIKVLTRDYEVVHHKLNLEIEVHKFKPSIPLPEDVMWAEDPLIAGWDVEGLYQPGWDGTDLNDATVTGDGEFIVSGDDYGTVRLHNYPAIVSSACKAYTGHAEFVVGVEFLRDDSQLITCGGDDKAIMQWLLTRN